MEVDLRKLLPKRAAGAVARAVRLTGDVTTRVEHATDRVVAPGADRRARGCTIAARARLIALADDRRTSGGEAGTQGIEVALLRLAVARPDGDAEACVRQHVPFALRAGIRLGDELAVLAHEQDRTVAIVDWGDAGGVVSAIQYAWPEPGEWPAPDAVEVRDGARHERRLAGLRERGTPAWATLLDASTRGGLTDRREDWKLTVELDGRRVELRERVPWLGAARLVERVEKGGSMVKRIERRPSTGTPVAVLVSPGGEVAADWERTLTALLTR